jgi:DNA invertase Pin-like site-specific DNA recombinase
MTSPPVLTDVNTHGYSCGTATASGTRRDVTTWKERHDAAVQKQNAAQKAYQEATDERAQALIDGEAELGSQAAVARELGVTRAGISRAINALKKKRL